MFVIIVRKCSAHFLTAVPNRFLGYQIPIFSKTKLFVFRNFCGRRGGGPGASAGSGAGGSGLRPRRGPPPRRPQKLKKKKKGQNLRRRVRAEILAKLCAAVCWPKSAPPCAGRKFGENLRRRVLAEKKSLSFGNMPFKPYHPVQVTEGIRDLFISRACQLVRK